MKINFFVEVPNPREATETQKKLSADLSELINARVKGSGVASSWSGDVNMILRVREKRTPDALKEVKPGLFLGFDKHLLENSDWQIFATVVRNAINANLNVPDEEKNCMVYFSAEEKDTQSLFPPAAADDDSEKSAIVFEAREPDFTLDEVIMSDKERRAVMRAVTMIRDKELIYNKWGFKKVDKNEKSILCFHGVPGTGKSMCAHAVASCLGKKIILGSYAQIESEFVGVGAKNLVALFKAAEKQDAVLFIDEADTFLSKRLPSSSDSAKHYNSMSNQLYTLIEGFNGCIVFASNHIKDFDPAVISRIIEPIEFRLPDFQGRKAILDKMIQDTFPLRGGKTDRALSELAEATEGFSGRDLRKAIQIAHAAIVWKYKYELGVPEEEIVAELDDLLQCVAEVREAKEKINPAAKPSAKDMLVSFAESETGEPII